MQLWNFESKVYITVPWFGYQEISTFMKEIKDHKKDLLAGGQSMKPFEADNDFWFLYASTTNWVGGFVNDGHAEHFKLDELWKNLHFLAAATIACNAKLFPTLFTSSTEIEFMTTVIATKSTSCLTFIWSKLGTI